MENLKQEYILCAAIHFDDGNTYVHQPRNIETGFVVCGRRHHNCFASFSAMRSVRGTTDSDIDNYPRNSEQGFLTSLDRFVGRKEAAVIAFNTGQITEKRNILFSEDLY